jgi:uncharacterized membrane protein YkvA (DUF1232 family)
MAKDYTLAELKKDIVPIVKRMPAYARLIRLLVKDPRLTRKDKVKLAAGVGYMASPIDLIPGIIPVLGQLDDIIAVLSALRSVLATAPAELVEPHMTEAGVTYEMIDRDISTSMRMAKQISVTAAKKTGRGIVRATKYVARKIAGKPKLETRQEPKPPAGPPD